MKCWASRRRLLFGWWRSCRPFCWRCLAPFGFTQSDLGNITGGGLTGFGIIILVGALIADKVGYGKLMIFAFIMHFLSAVVTLAATPIYNSMVASNPVGAKNAAYECLFWG